MMLSYCRISMASCKIYPCETSHSTLLPSSQLTKSLPKKTRIGEHSCVKNSPPNTLMTWLELVFQQGIPNDYLNVPADFVPDSSTHIRKFAFLEVNLPYELTQSVGRTVIISKKGGKFHFHAPKSYRSTYSFPDMTTRISCASFQETLSNQ